MSSSRLTTTTIPTVVERCTDGINTTNTTTNNNIPRNFAPTTNNTCNDTATAVTTTTTTTTTTATTTVTSHFDDDNKDRLPQHHHHHQQQQPQPQAERTALPLPSSPPAATAAAAAIVTKRRTIAGIPSSGATTGSATTTSMMMMNRRGKHNSTVSNSMKSAVVSTTTTATTTKKGGNVDRIGIRILELLRTSVTDDDDFWNHHHHHHHHRQYRQRRNCNNNNNNNNATALAWTTPIISYHNWMKVRNIILSGVRSTRRRQRQTQLPPPQRQPAHHQPPTLLLGSYVSVTFLLQQLGLEPPSSTSPHKNNDDDDGDGDTETDADADRTSPRSYSKPTTATAAIGRVAVSFILNLFVIGILSFVGTVTVTSISFTMILLVTISCLTLLVVVSLDLLLLDYINHNNNRRITRNTTTGTSNNQQRFVQQVGDVLYQLYTVFDIYIAQGRRYMGRNIWYTTTTTTRDIYLIGPDPNRNATTTTTVFTPLHRLTLPPLPSQSQQQSPWSPSTTKHLQAIQYCYTVQQRFDRRQSHDASPSFQKETSNTQQQHIIQSDHDATEVLQRSEIHNVDDEKKYDDDIVAITDNNAPATTTTKRSEDMAWIDVGAQIGLRLLHSEHVQRAMASQDTKERILETMSHTTNNNNNHSTKTNTTFMKSGNGGGELSKLSPNKKKDQYDNRRNDQSTNDSYPIVPSSNSMHDGTISPMTTTTTTTAMDPPNIVAVVPKPIHTLWTSPGSAAASGTMHNTHYYRSSGSRRDIRGGGENDGSTPSSFHRHHVRHTNNENNDDYDDSAAEEGDRGCDTDDDNDNYSIPLLRQSQSYPISPCSSPRTLLLQLPPLQSQAPTAVVTTTTGTMKSSPSSIVLAQATDVDLFKCQLPDLSRNAAAVATNRSSTAFTSTTTSGHDAPAALLHPIHDDDNTTTTTNTSKNIQNSDPNNIITSQKDATGRCLPSRSSNNHTCASIVQHSRQGRMHRRVPLLAGMKVAVPMSPYQPNHFGRSVVVSSKSSKFSYMMSTVVRSERIYVDTMNSGRTIHKKCISSTETEATNCLSVTVKLDKFFLRHGEFGELTFRVYDEWSTRYMPRYSKVPIGSCVATSYGVGVLVGWRVEDDCHIVRSLWQCRGSGTAYAYMNRSTIHKAMVAANGFRVQTVYGWGIVLACVKGGTTFTTCSYFVEIREENSRHRGNVLELDDTLILSCHGAQFMPVIEHVRAAALYQIQLDSYNAMIREQQLLHGERSAEKEEQEFLRTWSSCADILWQSFLKAVEEDQDFDDGVHDFVQSMIEFLDRLDKNDSPTHAEMTKLQGTSDRDGKSSLKQHLAVQQSGSDEIEIQFNSSGTDSSLGQQSSATQEPGFWFMNDLFGGIFKATNNDSTINNTMTDVSTKDGDASSNIEEDKKDDDGDIPVIKKKKSYFNRAFAVLRTVMKTVSIARASSVDHPHFRLALAISYDVLLFVRTILKIQQRNSSIESLKVWKRAWGEIIATFGPIQERLKSIGQGIAYRMENQGRKAKVRVLKFVDTILGDERLLFAMEQGEWDRCLARVEIALVEAEVIEEKNLIYYRKAATFVYEQIQMLLRNNEGAAARNTEKLAILGHLIQSMAAPRRSILKVFCREDMLELFERILVRAYYKEEVATRMLTIHAATFHSLRHLRILKDFSVSGRIWIPLLDAADEELSWFVSTLPENSKGIMLPVSRLFSLCVAQFHKINDGDLSKDWLAFLLEDESVQIIQEIDMLLILGLESFSRDIREMMTVLPYYASIDDDILNLMDEVNLDEFLREAASAIDNPEKLAEYIREKATIAIERFLNYLPKMSIPVEKRELGDGWVLSCHGSDGGGLTLTDVTIRRENLVCQIMGGDTLFFPMFNDDNENLYHDSHSDTYPVPIESLSSVHTNIRCDTIEEESILDHIKVLVMNAQKYGCWKVGFGGICQLPTDPYAASIFRDIPISNVLNCSIELWRNLQIDDDDLLEIAIRDISYHIQLQKSAEEAEDDNSASSEFQTSINPSLSEATSVTQLQMHLKNNNQYNHFTIPHRLSSSSSLDGRTTAASSQNQQQRRFNPRVDPTVLFLEIKRLTLNLDNFFFRIEKASDKKTIFDPVFAGRGMLSLQNISIRIRVECAKERVRQPQSIGGSGPATGIDIVTPILQLRQLEVSLEKVGMTVKDTGFGSDWILNKAVEVFEDKLTEVVITNLKDQIQEQLVQNVLESLNSYFLINPNLLLNVLGISMDDLDENVVWV